MALSDSRPTRRLCGVGAASPGRDGSPPITRITLPTCRAPYPGGSRRVPVSIASPLTRPSPFPRRVGIRIFTFEASSGFTRVTARWIAQPPKAAFVTRLQPGQLPDQTARQLPEQSTTLRVEPSSTGDTRRRGALGNPGSCHAHYPDGPGRVRASVASPSARPSPKLRRVGVRDFTFEACSGFTRVTACRIAQSPEATFVTRLRPGRLPLRTARQLPAQPTSRWVEPSSTGKPRRLGAQSFSGGWALLEAKSSGPNELIKAVATDFGTSEGR